jgi:hypothetical protein
MNENKSNVIPFQRRVERYCTICALCKIQKVIRTHAELGDLEKCSGCNSERWTNFRGVIVSAQLN